MLQESTCEETNRSKILIQALIATNEQIPYFYNPGVTYLKILEYYKDEKRTFKNVFDFDICENFISKYFEESIDMKIKIFDKSNIAYIIGNFILLLSLDGTFDTLPYIYLHKNKNLKNKWLFIDNYLELKGKGINGENQKIIKFKNAMNILDYKSLNCFIYFSAELKFSERLKLKQVNCHINDIEIHDTKNSKNISLFEMKESIICVYQAFKCFIDEMKILISDLDFLNNF